MSDQIDVNAIADVLNNKMDLDMHNVPANVDYVIESKYPTAQDPTWYRLYKSGWVEQGGDIIKTGGSNAANVVNLPIVMLNTNYFCIANDVSMNGGDSTFHLNCVPISTAQMNIYPHWGSTGSTIRWEVKGMSAQGGE